MGIKGVYSLKLGVISHKEVVTDQCIGDQEEQTGFDKTVTWW